MGIMAGDAVALPDIVPFVFFCKGVFILLVTLQAEAGHPLAPQQVKVL